MPVKFLNCRTAYKCFAIIWKHFLIFLCMKGNRPLNECNLVVKGHNVKSFLFYFSHFKCKRLQVKFKSLLYFIATTYDYNG